MFSGLQGIWRAGQSSGSLRVFLPLLGQHFLPKQDCLCFFPFSRYCQCKTCTRARVPLQAEPSSTAVLGREAVIPARTASKLRFHHLAEPLVSLPGKVSHPSDPCEWKKVDDDDANANSDQAQLDIWVVHVRVRLGAAQLASGYRRQQERERKRGKYPASCCTTM